MEDAKFPYQREAAEEAQRLADLWGNSYYVYANEDNAFFDLSGQLSTGPRRRLVQTVQPS